MQPTEPNKPSQSSPLTTTHPFLDKEKAVIEKEKAVVQKIEKEREKLSSKFPLPFALLGAFGLVATFYGFEGIINRIDFLYNNPILMLITGIVALVITGKLYQKLD